MNELRIYPRNTSPLKRFEIAGADRKWFWAANPEGANLVNGEGLPTSVFRTDDWKLVTEP